MPAEPTADTNTLVIRYTYEFDDGQRRTHDVHLDDETLELRESQQHPLPEWTRLENDKCPNCPLLPEQQAHCPAAVALANVATGFGERPSYSPVKVTVDTPSRTITKQTALAEALFPLVGLRMAASGCPVLRQLRPMARFHLPLSTAQETMYRAASMDLLAQYFIKQAGGRADLELDGLVEIYQHIAVLNRHMAERIREATTKDAALNALMVLDFFVKNLFFRIDTHLEDLQHLFEPYVELLHQGPRP